MLNKAKPLSRSCVTVLRRYVLRKRGREMHLSQVHVMIGIVANICRRTYMVGKVVCIGWITSRVSDNFFGRLFGDLLDQ